MHMICLLTMSKKIYQFMKVFLVCILCLFNTYALCDSVETEEVFRTPVDHQIQSQIDEFCEKIRNKELNSSLEVKINSLIMKFREKGMTKVDGENIWIIDKALKDLRDFGIVTIPLLEKALVDKDPLIRQGAIIALYRAIKKKEREPTRRVLYISNVKDSIPIFIRSLNDVDEEVRRGTIIYLANVAFWELDLKPLIIPHIVKMLNDPSHSVAYQAAASLVKLGKRDLVPENLLKEVGDEVE